MERGAAAPRGRLPQRFEESRRQVAQARAAVCEERLAESARDAVGRIRAPPPQQNLLNGGDSDDRALASEHLARQRDALKLAQVLELGETVQQVGDAEHVLADVTALPGMRLHERSHAPAEDIQPVR
jgi:hypothetical protein